MTRSSSARIRFPPASHDDFDRGVAAIVGAIRPTLGPIPRTVGIERPVRTMTPQLLDNGAEIARRIVALPNIHQDPGAMFIRGLLWRLNEELGDGTATAAVIFSSILSGGRRAIAAGISAQVLRGQLDRIADIVFDSIIVQARSCSGNHDLANIARSVCHDLELAILLGDVADVVGATGQIDLRPSRRNESWREFVQGSFWESGLLSATSFGDPARQRTDIHDAAILITNLDIEEPREMIALLESVRASRAGGLLLIAASISSALAGLLHANSLPGAFPIVVARTPVQDQQGTIADLATMTGGRAFLREAGDTIARLEVEDIGRARTVWATRLQFGVVAGQGDSRSIRELIDTLQASYQHASNNDMERSLLQRLGKFQGMSATLWIGANSDLEAKARLENAGRAIHILRVAMREGVVPGGGSALVHSQAALNVRRDASFDTTERAALEIVIEALQAPARTVLANCGYEAAPLIATMKNSGPSHGFDVISGVCGDMHEMGIVDPAGVISRIARASIRSAALALTVDVIVHTNSTEASVDPE